MLPLARKLAASGTALKYAFTYICSHPLDGYDNKEVQYTWTHGEVNSIAMSPDMRLSQFDLIGTPAGKDNITHLSNSDLNGGSWMN